MKHSGLKLGRPAAALAAVAAAGLLLVAGCAGADDTSADEEVSAPLRSDPAVYTQFVVDDAIARYTTEGLEATLAHYNDPANVDGEWYVFVIDRDDTVIGHYQPDRRGLDVKGAVGTDINGYNFGPEMLSATEAGRWVPYVYVNPAAESLGDDDMFELKSTWVVRHDGLLFGSGWYVDTEELAPLLFLEAAEHFRSGGLEAYFAFSNDPTGINAGLIPAAQYYNRTNTLDGYFTGIVAAPDGEILAHIDPGLIGTDIEDLLGPAVRNATAEGGWIVAKDNPADTGHPRTMRMWLIDVDGTLIGGGWYRNDSTG